MLWAYTWLIYMISNSSNHDKCDEEYLGFMLMYSMDGIIKIVDLDSNFVV